MDSLLADIETDTIGLVDTMMFKAKSKKPIQEISDVQIIKIFPK